MRYVDHDPTAARVAALRCRDAAHSYDRIAGVVAAETAGVAWWGRERDRVVAEAEVLATDLRREAAALRASADRLEQAARAAERQEAERQAEAEAAAAAAGVCLPTSSGPTMGHASQPTSTKQTSRASATSAQGVPTGVA